MKRAITIFTACLVISLPVLSQEGSPITIQKKGFARHYMQNDQRIDKKELRTILEGYPPSAQEYKAASRNSTAGMLLVSGGALVIGASSLYDALKDLDALNSGSLDVGNTSVVPYLVGCGMIVGGIPLMLIGNSHLIKSFSLYNAQFKASNMPDATMQLSLTPVGAGIKISF
jgi:predicted DNA repair protein MutK